MKLPSEHVLLIFKLMVVPINKTSGSVVRVCEAMEADVDGPLLRVSESILAGVDGLLLRFSESMLTGVDGLLFSMAFLQFVQIQVVLALLGYRLYDMHVR